MEQEEIKEIEQIEQTEDPVQELTEVVEQAEVDTLVMDLKQEYEQKLLAQKEQYEKKLIERDKIIKQILTTDKQKQPDFIEEINKRRSAQNKI